MSGPAAGRPSLERRLGLRDAVVLGLGSMVGAGIFAALAPAASAAGGLLPVAVLVAGVVAWFNATSSGRLAAVHPQAGGTYVYATVRLGRVPGHLAGWAFVVGKTASCAAMAFTVGAYALPEHPRPVALAAVALVVLLGTGGVQRGARLTRASLALSLVVLAVVVALGWAGDAGTATTTTDAGPSGVADLLQASGLMFFAFAGYARIATLGEEVRTPERTIPRAINVALGLVVVLYLVVAVSALHVLGPDRLAASAAPLRDVVEGAGHAWAAPLVRVGAVAASLGALLGLLLGVSRVLFAMARDGHLPRGLTGVRRGVPHVAELTVAVVVAGVVLVADLREVIGFSSTTVLTYYALTHLAAWRLRPDEGRPARAVLVLGLAGCVVLALTLPALSVVVGVAVLAVGLAVGLALNRRPLEP